jgi:uncharacterized metal-binding protein
MARPRVPLCAKCPIHACYPEGADTNTHIDLESAPPFCPMKLHPDILKKASDEYNKESVREFARQASIQEGECYETIDGKRRTKIPRIEETIQFARKMNYKKLGMVFCLGLADEAAMLSTIFENAGFEVVSVCCKVGGVPKEDIGLMPEQKITSPEQYESMCNPIAQAEIMNEETPDLVILVGLCVGHDSLFIQYCTRPITVLVAKDRVMAHNPLGALYTSATYYKRLRE